MANRYHVTEYRNYYGTLMLGIEFENSRTVMSQKKGRVMFTGTFAKANRHFERLAKDTNKYGNRRAK